MADMNGWMEEQTAKAARAGSGWARGLGNRLRGVQATPESEAVGQQLDEAKTQVAPRPRAGPERYKDPAGMPKVRELQGQYENALGNPTAVQNSPGAVTPSPQQEPKNNLRDAAVGAGVLSTAGSAEGKGLLSRIKGWIPGANSVLGKAKDAAGAVADGVKAAFTATPESVVTPSSGKPGFTPAHMRPDPSGLDFTGPGGTERPGASLRTPGQPTQGNLLPGSENISRTVTAAEVAKPATPGLLRRAVTSLGEFAGRANPYLLGADLAMYSPQAGKGSGYGFGDKPGREATPEETKFYQTVGQGKAGIPGKPGIADTMAGKRPNQQMADLAATVPPTGQGIREQQPKPAAATVTPDGTAPRIPTSQGSQTPGELIQGTAVPDRGFGAIQRTDEPGHEAVGIGMRNRSFDGLGPMPATATPQQAAEWLKKTNTINQLRAGGAQAIGPKPGSINARALEAREEERQFKHETLRNQQSMTEAQHKANRLQQEHARRIQDAQEQRAQGESTLKNRSNEIENKARNQVKMDIINGKSDTSKYAEDVKAKHGEMMGRYEYTLQNMGKSMDTATAGDVSKLHLYEDVKNSLEGSRGGWRKLAGDIVGTNRADSNDLRDYAADHYEDSSLPFTKWLVLKSGEKVPVSKAGGGGMNWLSPNDPIYKNVITMADAADKKWVETHPEEAKKRGF